MVSLEMFNGMVGERLLIDTREKIQNCWLRLFTGRLTRMDDILYLILTTQNKVKRHSQRLYSVYRQRQALYMKNSQEIHNSLLLEM
jgi:hypothetical protein